MLSCDTTVIYAIGWQTVACGPSLVPHLICFCLWFIYGTWLEKNQKKNVSRDIKII